ncbi:MAG: PDZ domain-containing protein [Lachnospiraceae bacterium]|nr:PDZ domain-containing protein [Lachnospiraceae bacterium]
MTDDEKNRNTINEDFYQDEEPYAFMKETVKKRPGRVRRFLLKVVGIAAGGVLFGAAAGLVFSNMVQENPLIFFENDESADELPDDKEPGGSVSSYEEAASDSTALPVSPDPAEETSGENGTDEPGGALSGGSGDGDGGTAETMTPEERRKLLVKDHEELYSAFKAVAYEAEKSLVTVQTIVSTEDWFRTENQETLLTSGLIIAETGKNMIILTTGLSLEEGCRLMVILTDGTAVEAELIRTDSQTGLSVLRISTDKLADTTKERLKTAELGNSYGITKGEPVIAVGRPGGQTDSLAFGTITSTRSAVDVSDGLYQLFTTDMYGSYTSSGFLINMEGQVIGCLTQYGSDTLIKALAVSPIKTLISFLSNNQAIPYLGIHGEDVTKQISDATGMPIGVYVTAVDADSPAFLAGIQPGDILVSLNESSVSAMSVYNPVLMKLNVSDSVKLTVMRSGAEGYVDMTFGMTAGGI